MALCRTRRNAINLYVGTAVQQHAQWSAVGPVQAVATRCIEVCTTQCGDGIIAGTEECDDGNTVAGDSCATNCTLEDAQRHR